MKKLIALALALVMAFALCACGQQAAPAAEAPAAAETETQIEASTEAPAVDLSNLNVTCVVPMTPAAAPTPLCAACRRGEGQLQEHQRREPFRCGRRDRYALRRECGQ